MRLQEHGATVIPNDIRQAKLETVYQQGIGHDAVVADIASRVAVDEMINHVGETQGRLDILVNNAGVEPKSPLLEITDEQWNAAIAVNLTGVFYCTQIAARHMTRRGQGRRIIQISSIAGKTLSRTARTTARQRRGSSGSRASWHHTESQSIASARGSSRPI